MENSFQTSFIPKKPISSVGKISPKAKSLFRTIGIFLIIIVSVAAIGLFLYKNYLSNQKESLSNSLSMARESFEEETIKELELFDRRTSVAIDLLGKHTVFFPMFKLLGELTIPSVQYTKFEHQTNEKGFFVKMSGIARDYRSIALQADVFNNPKGHYFKNVVFSNLVKDRNNYVTFNVEFSVDPSLLSYEKNFLLEEQESLNPLSDDSNNN